MSHNQSRADRSEFTQYKKATRSGSSNQQRQGGGGAFTKGGDGASNAPSNPPNCSFNKKYNSNAQGGQRPRSPNMSADSTNSSAAPVVQNGAHQPQPTNRLSDAPVTSVSSSLRPTDAPDQKLNRVLPRSQSSQVTSATQPSSSSSASSESKATATPTKADESRLFPLQFGSISPGFMNGVQIPARTSSAPPNLDEQKKAQARHVSLRAAPAPAIPIPSIPKQHLSKKDVGTLDQPGSGETQMLSKSKRDVQVSTAPSMTQSQMPSVHQVPGMHMQMPQFHQLPVPVQFGGPNPQIHSQAMSGSSMPMPMPMPMQMPVPLSIGNPPVQQPMFVQGMMHHGQSLNFSPQMGPQLSHQLGNMRMNMVPQFSPQQAGKYTGSRKTVKITHPDTHEELRLDSSPGPRSHLNLPPQSQHIPSFPNQPMNFRPNFFPPASSVTHSSAQVPLTSQLPRFYNQVTVKPAVSSHAEKELLPRNSHSVGKVESLKPERLHVEELVHPRKEIEPPSSFSLQDSKPGLGTPFTYAASSLLMGVSARTEVVVRDSTKDELKKLGHPDKVEEKSVSLPSLSSQLLENVAMKSPLSRTNMVPETAKDSSLRNVAVTSEVSNLTSKGDASESLETENESSKQSNLEKVEKSKGHVESISSESTKPDTHTLATSMESLSLESPEIIANIGKSSEQVETSTTASGLLGQTQQKLEESSGTCPDDVKMADNIDSSSHTAGDENNESSVPTIVSSGQDIQIYLSDTMLSVPDSIGSRETTVAKSIVADEQLDPVVVPSPREGTLKPENEDNISGSLVSPSLSDVKDKALLDTIVAKPATPKGKMKRKDLYRKAEAAGPSSDLYMAYKGPEEKKEIITSAEEAENIKQTSADASVGNAAPSEKPVQTKVELDNWEDAAEISTPQLETLTNGNQGLDGEDVNELLTKRYSRDFLLKFLEQYTELPEGFEITSGIEALMASNVNSRESFPSSGRNIDRTAGNSRPDRRGIGMDEEDKWNKFPDVHMSGRGDMRSDLGYGANVAGFRPSQGQGGNYGVLRNPRAPTSLQNIGGILSGPMQPLGPQGSLQRNNSDSDRWQRGIGFQKGLMPSPQGPQAVMHKAERKYEVGKVTDEEQAKQRQLKGILNKLTPQNFEKLFQQVKEVNIDNGDTLSGVISQIFDKALMEPTFCEMYANFCFHLAADLPDLSVEDQKITFKRLLLNKCQEEFERGEREEEEANKAEVEGDGNQTAEEREEKRLQTRRRMLGNIRLIGELYKKRMLTERIMHECINKLLGQTQNPDEENIEALCKLMSTIGAMIDHSRAKGYMDVYFDIMGQLSSDMKLSSRVRFMLRDSIDLRKNKWQQRRKVEGPKKIDEVHRDAAQERHAQSSRLARPSSFGGSARRPPPMDFGPRTPNILSPSSQIGGYRALSPQIRGYGSQDARTERNSSFDSRTISIPLTQRPLSEDFLTLGPQGGLARGMTYRGQPSSHNIPLGDMSGLGDARRMGHGQTGLSSVPERTVYGQRDEVMPRYASDRFAASSIIEQSHLQEESSTYGNREAINTDHSFDKFLPTPPARGGPSTNMQHDSSKNLSEEVLRNKSIAAIKEFYSARDEKELAMCIKDLNNPSFYPSMISVWVTDSFERKDMEREILTKLLISLTKTPDVMINGDQLTKGFELVLTVLEDVVNDAPRAWEFLGRIFAQVIMKNIVSFSEIGRLIYEGGEEQGQLLENGLAAKILGTILEIIESEKGDCILNEIRSSSNLQLENFRPPGYNRPLLIDKFI